MRDAIIELIIEAAAEHFEELEAPPEDRLEASTVLFGEGGVLDSMSLVSLVVAVEQAIEERFGVSVALADEKALSQKSSPYRTIASLAEYAHTQVEQSSSHE